MRQRYSASLSSARFSFGVAGGADGFVQAEEREAGGVELVADRVAVLLEQRGFARAVILVALRGAEVTAADLTKPLMDRAGRLLPGEQVVGYPGQPLTVLGGVLDADEPGQAEQHASAFEVVLPAPLVGIDLHRHGNGGPGAVEEGLEAGVLPGPQIAGPEIRFKVRRVINRSPLVIGFPAVLLQGRQIYAVGAKAEFAGGAEVGDNARMRRSSQRSVFKLAATRAVPSMPRALSSP